MLEITDDDGSCRADGAKRERWGDADQIAKWRLEETAVLTQIGMDKDAAKADYDDLTLGELKERYGKAIGRARQSALLAVFIQYITC